MSLEFEAGLFGMAFHPTENYFLVSYSNRDNYLTVEKYYLDDNSLPQSETNETVISIPSPLLSLLWKFNLV